MKHTMAEWEALGAEGARAWREWRKARERDIVPTPEQIAYVRQVGPEYCLDDDWPDVSDQIAAELAERFEIEDEESCILADKIMQEIY